MAWRRRSRIAVDMTPPPGDAESATASGCCQRSTGHVEALGPQVAACRGRAGKRNNTHGGLVESALPTSIPSGSIWNSPDGRPASSRIRARTTLSHTVVPGSGLSRTALPRARAGLIRALSTSRSHRSACGRARRHAGAQGPVRKPMSRPTRAVPRRQRPPLRRRPPASRRRRSQTSPVAGSTAVAEPPRLPCHVPVKIFPDQSAVSSRPINLPT
jgi:hypothetical protein